MSKSIKQVIVMRRDLNMRRGKEIAQGAHASISFLAKAISKNQKISKVEAKWFETGQTKICVRVESEEELLTIYQQAKDAMIEVNLITDAGHTEFDGVPTMTCLAIGPDYAEKIDPITGNLKLL